MNYIRRCNSYISKLSDQMKQRTKLKTKLIWMFPLKVWKLWLDLAKLVRFVKRLHQSEMTATISSAFHAISALALINYFHLSSFAPPGM